MLLRQAALVSRQPTNPPHNPTARAHTALQDSKYYSQFRLYCCEAYEILRKSADLILSLFHLMAGASIEAIRNNPENAMLKLQVGLMAGFQGWVCLWWGWLGDRLGTTVSLGLGMQCWVWGLCSHSCAHWYIHVR